MNNEASLDAPLNPRRIPSDGKIEVPVAVWNGVTWAFPLTWTELARAPLSAGWEIRQEVRVSPDLESGTPYLVFRFATYGVVVAMHPNAVRIAARSLSRLVKA